MKIDLWLQCYPGQWTITQTNTNIWYCHLFFSVKTVIGQDSFKVIGEGSSRLDAVKKAILQYCDFQNDPAPILLEA